MLPDFPLLKSQLAERQQAELHLAMNAQMPIVSKIKSFRCSEGDGLSFQRTDGKIEHSKYRKFEKRITISTRLGFNDTVTEVNEELRRVAQELAAHQEKLFFETMHRVTAEVGNQIDTKGEPFSAELWLDGLEKTEIEFDDFGFPELPTPVIHPAWVETYRKEVKRIDTEPRLNARAQQILVSKRKDWRDRESRRRLAD